MPSAAASFTLESCKSCAESGPCMLKAKPPSEFRNSQLDDVCLATAPWHESTTPRVPADASKKVQVAGRRATIER